MRAQVAPQPETQRAEARDRDKRAPRQRLENPIGGSLGPGLWPQVAELTGLYLVAVGLSHLCSLVSLGLSGRWSLVHGL